MAIQTFHYKYIKTPEYYWSTIIKVALIVILIASLHFKYEVHERIALIIWVITWPSILIGTIVYLFKKKYVNYLKINYDEKTIEAFFIKPFKECSVKSSLSNFEYSYKTISYDLFRIRTWKELQMIFNNETKLKISELEITFTPEEIREIVEALAKLKHESTH